VSRSSSVYPKFFLRHRILSNPFLKRSRDIGEKKRKEKKRKGMKRKEKKRKEKKRKEKKRKEKKRKKKKRKEKKRKENDLPPLLLWPRDSGCLYYLF
jgi:DNA-directed RNA polymerase specialized sigma54-like protein